MLTPEASTTESVLLKVAQFVRAEVGRGVRGMSSPRTSGQVRREPDSHSPAISPWLNTTSSRPFNTNVQLGFQPVGPPVRDRAVRRVDDLHGHGVKLRSFPPIDERRGPMAFKGTRNGHCLLRSNMTKLLRSSSGLAQSWMWRPTSARYLSVTFHAVKIGGPSNG